MNKIICGDALEILKTMPESSVNMCVTSPPYYGLRDYGADGQIGLEQTPEEYVARLVDVFREMKRVLMPDGTLWLNIGDSYAGSGKGAGYTGVSKQSYLFTADNPAARMPKVWNGIKPKDMMGIPWALAFALRNDGWYLRSDIIWRKPNTLPESVTDRPTKSYEHLFLLAKSARYYYDSDAIKEPLANGSVERMMRGNYDTNKYANGAPGQTPQSINKPRKNMKNMQYDGQQPNSFHVNRANGGTDKIYEKRNKRDVWDITTVAYHGAHFATFPEKLIEPCILAGCPVGGIVADPFFGSGTTGVTALRLGRQYIGIDINPEYCGLAENRIQNFINNQEVKPS